MYILPVNLLKRTAMESQKTKEVECAQVVAALVNFRHFQRNNFPGITDTRSNPPDLE